MNFINQNPAALLLAGLALSTTASASLEPRPGGMVYDTDLNITWLADANAFKTQTEASPNLVTAIIDANSGVIQSLPRYLDTPSYSGTYVLSEGDFSTGDGKMTWWGAQAWVGYLNNIGYEGYSDWRLPTTDNCWNYHCTNSEMGHLFYSELEAQVGQSILQGDPTELAKFTNIKAWAYWSCTEYAPNPDELWVYSNLDGYQFRSNSTVDNGALYAWAVRSGDVAAVPVPATGWLLGSAVAGLVAAGRRNKAASGLR